MSRDNTRSDDAVQLLLSAFQKLEESGLPRPAIASWSEFLAALAVLHVLPEETATRLIAEYHRLRFSRSTHDDSGLRETLDALSRAIREFESLDAPKREELAKAVQDQFRPAEGPQRPLVEPEAHRPAPVPVMIDERAPELPPMDPQEVLAVPNQSGKRLQRRVMIYAGGAIVLVWTLGVLAGGYVVHDSIEQFLASATRVREKEESTRRNVESDERHVARENWSSRPSSAGQNQQYDRRTAETLFNLARAHDAKNETREAIFAYHLLLKQQPRHTLAGNNLAFLLLTTHDKSLHDPKRALEMAQSVVERDVNAAYLDTLAEAWFQNRNPVKAAIFGLQAMRARDHEFHMPYLLRQMVRFSLEVLKEGFVNLSLLSNTRDAYAWISEPPRRLAIRREGALRLTVTPDDDRPAEAPRPAVADAEAKASAPPAPPAAAPPPAK
ncbi:MAG: hypothetical protein AB7O26_04960 [Planctomycetaceae bacterium]